MPSSSLQSTPPSLPLYRTYSVFYPKQRMVVLVRVAGRFAVCRSLGDLRPGLPSVRGSLQVIRAAKWSGPDELQCLPPSEARNPPKHRPSVDPIKASTVQE